MVLGIDEVGRGAWAGPMVVGAVVLGDARIDGLTDSKKLTAKHRQRLASQIKQQALGIGLGWVSADTIDKIGLSQALQMAARLAVKDITVGYDRIIIDGTVPLIDDARVSTIKRADLLIPSVSAASIIAKVARDYYMSTIASKEYPNYGFDRHVGYGTALHKTRLESYGTCDLHRLSFDPVKQALGQEIARPIRQKIGMTIGRKAEQVAATYLAGNGFEIVATNWRTKLCEIDIIAKKQGVAYLVEVKYRQKADHGDGMVAITPKKLRRMKFAARVWQHWHQWPGDIKLSVLAMHNDPPSVDQWLLELE